MAEAGQAFQNPKREARAAYAPARERQRRRLHQMQDALQRIVGPVAVVRQLVKPVDRIVARALVDLLIGLGQDLVGLLLRLDLPLP